MNLNKPNCSPTKEVVHISRRDEIRAILIEERKNRGLPQEQFADLLGVSKRIVTAWETGDRNPGNMELIDAALRKLGRSVTLGTAKEARNGR